MARWNVPNRLYLKVKTEARDRLHFTKGSIPLAIYVFFGLTFIEYSWVRACSAFVASVIVLFWGSNTVGPHECEADSWHWSAATTKGVCSALVLSLCGMIPFAVQRTTTKLGSSDGISLAASLLFSGMVAVILYLRIDHGPSGKIHQRRRSIESLTLEHQRCMTLYETLATATTLLFTATLLTPVLASSDRLGELTLQKLIWAFYFFSGIVVWLLRPCTARAAVIRLEIDLIHERQNRDYSDGPLVGPSPSDV